MLDATFKEKKISYHPHCEKIGLTHLCFDDDLIIFLDASPLSLRGINQVLEDFCTLFGLQVSCQKCELFCCRVPLDDQNSLACLLGMQLGKLPVRYLGVPLISGKLRDMDCQSQVDKETSRIRTWTS